EVYPSEKIDISVQIRGKNIANSKNKSEGAGFYVESYDEKGVFITGLYPKGYTGTFEWKQLEGKFVVPENAKSTTIGLYLRKGTVGESWFDDVSVVYSSKPQEASIQQAVSVQSNAKVYIDEEGYTIKNGKKIFPLGI